MGDLDEDAAAVAALRVGAHGAAMVHVLEDGEALLDDGVRLAVLHVGDETDAAGILLAGGIVEALGGREGRDRGRKGQCWRAWPCATGRRLRMGSFIGAFRSFRVLGSFQVLTSAQARHGIDRGGFGVCRRLDRPSPAVFLVLEGRVLRRGARSSRAHWAGISRDLPVPPTFCGRLSWCLVSFASGEASTKSQGRKAQALQMGQHGCPNELQIGRLHRTAQEPLEKF